jgi:hypothetical protein
MNKRLLLAVVAVFFLVAMKHAFGQDEPMIGWEPVWQDDPVQDVAFVMLAAPILGAIFGAFRLLSTNSREPEMGRLRLR